MSNSIKVGTYLVEDLGADKGPQTHSSSFGNGYSTGSYKYVSTVRVTNGAETPILYDMFTAYGDGRASPLMCAFSANNYNGWYLHQVDTLDLSSGSNLPFRVAVYGYTKIFIRELLWWPFVLSR